MPEEGVPLRRHEEFLSQEQIAEVVAAGVKLGLTKIRLTGGEPLVKRGIVDLAARLRAVPGVRHLRRHLHAQQLLCCAGHPGQTASGTRTTLVADQFRQRQCPQKARQSSNEIQCEALFHRW